ncbi:uncharacterized protein FOMMEDRAFT_156115 [Fomitiporia mediterranea MF3/22]|uniref:uncharacterized protein n=1 Tax=Fomitiporia mediterranea (strain MF3/22) TaxID=694068 RepID=UPI0004408E20|nr:uncharacterized protein FOMMEDRAFT_156115 [Fomitiporia mediterranea MF3/22]EJD02774.1 hypothetical protein FOMMEDRAFT_156115 [Fomitiporia mediterranea MF3/22]
MVLFAGMVIRYMKNNMHIHLLSQSATFVVGLLTFVLVNNPLHTLDISSTFPSNKFPDFVNDFHKACRNLGQDVKSEFSDDHSAAIIDTIQKARSLQAIEVIATVYDTLHQHCGVASLPIKQYRLSLRFVSSPPFPKLRLIVKHNGETYFAYPMNVEPLEVLFEFPIEDIVPVPPAPQMRPIELPGDDEGHDWYIRDAPLEGNALHFFDAQTADVGIIAPLEPENDYENFGVIQRLLDTVNNVNETLQNLRQDVQSCFGNDLDVAAIDVCQEARNMLAMKIIDTVGMGLAHHGGDETYPIQVLLAILMERFTDGRAEDGDIEILNVIIGNINA